MLRNHKSLFILLVITFLPLPSVKAAQIYAVETTSFIQQACGANGTPALARIASAIETESAGLDASTVGLIGIADTAQLLNAPGASRETLLTALKALQAGSGRQLDIAGGLYLAQELLQNQSGDGHRISLFVSPTGLARSADFGKQVLALMRQGIAIELVLTCPATPTQTHAGLQLRVLGDADSDDPMLVQLRALLAPLFGLEADALGLDDDFIRDLHSDSYSVIEAVQLACAHFKVIAPQRDDLKTLRQLAEYIRTAEQEGRTVRAMGPREQPGIPEPVYLQTVFYGTNRKPADTLDEPPFYTGERAPKGAISYGQVQVSIPVNVHEKGRIETPFLSLNFFLNPKKHIYIKQLTRLSKDSFFQHLNQNLTDNKTGENWDKDIVVFVHGFNVSFENAAKRTAQLAYDFDFKGSPLMFSWPSNNELLGYVADREDIEWSVPHIQMFLEDIVSRAEQARRIHIVAHSMGNEGLLRALRSMALSRPASTPPLFTNVVLAAPDVDAEIFADQMAPSLVPLAERWTLYASDNDAALNLSSTLRSAPRLGLPLTVVNGVDTVDATGIEVTPWSVPEFHSYYATKQRVIEDFIAVLQGIAPLQRQLKPAVNASRHYWILRN